MAILAVLRQAAREIYRRLMDAVDPALTGQAEHALLHTIPRLSAALVHADPAARGSDPHEVLADHRPSPASAPGQS